MSGIIPFLINCLLLAGLIAGAALLQNYEREEQAPTISVSQEAAAASSTDAATQTTVETSAPQVSAPAATVKPSIRGIYNDDDGERDD
jgi:hypothetical protein